MAIVEQSGKHTMAKEPAVVTDGWPEISGSLARTGLFGEDQLNPKIAPRVLADLVRRYTTVVGYEAEGRVIPVGSGTFLRRTDGQHGILTAGHVVGAIKNKESLKPDRLSSSPGFPLTR